MSDEEQPTLLPGEQVEKFESELSLPWEAGNLRVITEHFRWSIDVILTLFDAVLNLAPEYQRRRRWDTTRQTRLIESLMLNVPVPPIFLLEIKDGTYEVMDGLQRLTAILDFYTDKYALNTPPVIKDIHGLKYSELPERYQRAFRRSTLSAITLLEESTQNKSQKDWMKLMVFERINSGGIQLDPQEIRQALNPGRMNDLCTLLSRHPTFTRCWGYTIDADGAIASEWKQVREKAQSDYTCMKDVERVLRFFALRQRSQNPKAQLREHLDEYLANANWFPETTILSLESLFIGTLEVAQSVFGKDTFTRWGAQDWYTARSELVYDAVTQAISMRIEHRNTIEEKSALIKEDLKTVLSSKSNTWKSNYAQWHYTKARIGEVLAILDRHIFVTA
jgi:hypothetical protein